MEKVMYEEYTSYLQSKSEVFKLSEVDKYARYGMNDPLPRVSPSLLNSEDILKYILLAGIIDKFNIEDLQGATYSCRVSGECIYYNDDKQVIKQCEEDSGKIEIRPNSITFVAIKHTIRVPSYMALRFNLKVRHVYKGLLLGTGPIIDPGFVGKIYIPLHNLTSNTYFINNDARLIDVEFTKLSNNTIWKAKKDEFTEIFRGFNKVVYTPQIIKADRELVNYLEKSLTDKEVFLEKNTPMSITSAVTDQIKNVTIKIKKNEELIEKEKATLEEKIKEFNTIITNQKSQIDKDSTRMEKTESYVKSFTLFAIISILVACISLFWSASSFLSNTSKLSDAQKKIETQEQKYDDAQNGYKLRIDEMQRRIDDLEKKLNEVKIP